MSSVVQTLVNATELFPLTFQTVSTSCPAMIKVFVRHVLSVWITFKRGFTADPVHTLSQSSHSTRLF